MTLNGMSVDVAYAGFIFLRLEQDMEMWKALNVMEELMERRSAVEPRHPLARRARGVVQNKRQSVATSLSDGNMKQISPRARKSRKKQRMSRSPSTASRGEAESKLPLASKGERRHRLSSSVSDEKGYEDSDEEREAMVGGMIL